jgi:hypothetical protein
MLRSIFTSLSIYLQGTVFERRPRVKGKQSPEAWMHIEEDESHTETVQPQPYVIVEHELEATPDLVSKLYSCNRRLKDGRVEAKNGRAKWCQNKYQQNYTGAVRMTGDPQVEVYWKALGLGNTQEQQFDW